MKGPSQTEDLRQVSAFSVYNGLAPGLKSYQDTSGESRNKQRRKKAKRKNRNSQTEVGLKTEEKPETVNVKRSKESSGLADSVVDIQHADVTNAKKSKKKRKKKNKNASNDNSEREVIVVESEDDDYEAPSAKEMKLSDDILPNPLAQKGLKNAKQVSAASKSSASLNKSRNVVPTSASTLANSPPKAVTREEGKTDSKNKNQKKNKSSNPEPRRIVPTPVSTPVGSSKAVIREEEKKEKKSQKKNKAKEDPAIAKIKPDSCKNGSPKKGLLVSQKDKASTSKSSMAVVGPIANGYSKSNDSKVESKVPPPDLKSIFGKGVIEESVAHGKKVLDWLIHPISSDEFMQKYWEKRPLLIKRKHQDSEDYYKWMLTTQSFDDVLRRNVIKYGVNLDVTSYENGVRETISENLQGRVRPAVVWDYYNNGCSVRMLNPQTYVQQLWKVNSSLQEWFGSFVGANVYLTPPNSQGFAPHYDDIEAFILQVEGKKQWKVYRPRNPEETLPRFSSPNFSEDKDDLGEPVIDEVLEEGDLLYFPRGWIHQAKTVEGLHSLHITLSCHQLNTYGDLLKHHVNQALDKLIASDVSFRQGLPTDYMSFMGIAHRNTEDPELIRKRSAFSKKIGGLVSKIANESSDYAADAMAKKFMWDSLPPFYTRKERETCVLDGGEFMMEGRVFNRVEFGPEVEVRVIRRNCLRLLVEEGTLKLYYNTENPLIYHEQEAQFLEIGIEHAPAVNHLICQYPNFTKIEDLPLTSNDIGQKVQIIADLWERGLISTKEPLEPCDDDGGPEESENEDDVESINLSDLPQEGEEDDDDDESSDDFYDTTMTYEVSDSDDESFSDGEIDDGQADVDAYHYLGESDDVEDEELGEEEELDEESDDEEAD